MVVPPATPVIAPELVIVATAVLLLVHEMPPLVASLTNPVTPTHTVLAPVMLTGLLLTVILYVLKQPVLVSV